MKLTLHGYKLSSASWRVRNVLAMKGIDFKWVEVDLNKELEEQHISYQQLSPNKKVPMLEIDDNGKMRYMSESSSICEFLDEIYKNPQLLPKSQIARQ